MLRPAHATFVHAPTWWVADDLSAMGRLAHPLESRTEVSSMSTTLVKGRGVKPGPTSPEPEPTAPDILSRLLDEAERLENDERPATPAPSTEPIPPRLFAFD